MVNVTRQLIPRCKGQLTWMAEPICHSFRSLVRPHDYHHSGLWTDGQGRTERVNNADAVCAPFYVQFVAEGVVYVVGPQRELPPARLVIHRTDLCQHNVENAGSAIEVGLAYFFPQQH